MLQELNKVELVAIDGGHEGESYKAGVAVGEFMTKVGTIMGIIGVLIFAPKS